MSITGKNSLSIRKQDVREQKSLAIGFRKTMFAHKATAGDTGIDLDSLDLPSEMVGFTNPNPADILAAQLFFYRKNLTLISSSRGVLIDYLSYSVATSNRIDFIGFTAAADEIFTGVIDYNPRNGLQVVDAAPLISSGTLAVGVNDFNVGQVFEVNKYASYQVGAIIVYRNGLQQFRNTNNSTVTLDGNYYEVNNGSGQGSVIHFNDAPVSVDDNILVISNGLIASAPEGSTMQAVESLAGQIDAMIPTLAALAGVPETDFQAAPNNVDLKSFGDYVIALLGASVPIVTNWVAFTPTGSWTTNTTYAGFKRRVGDSEEVRVYITLSGAPGGGPGLTVDTPSVIDASKLAGGAVTDGSWLGTGYFVDSATTAYDGGYVQYFTASSIRITHAISSTTNLTTTPVTTTAPFSFNTGDVVILTFSYPVVGWNATQTMREQLGF